MESALNILLVDDDEDYFIIVESMLDDAPGDFELEWISNYKDGLHRLTQGCHDVCLVDYMIGSEVGLEFVQQAIEAGVKSPMVLLTGLGQHDIDLAASEAGASDFLDKGNLTPTLLERAVRYSVTNAKAMEIQEEQSIILETTLKSIQAGVAMFDAAGRLKTSNDLFAALVTQDNLPQGWPGAVDQGAEADVAEIGEQILRYFLRAGPSVESEFTDDDGRTFEVRVDPIESGGNVMLLTDVTAQKSLQRDILKAKQTAEAANQMKSAFLAKVSHELRTPLNGVFGMSQLLKLSDLDTTQERNLDILIESASSLMGLIEDLLDLSVIEQGEFVLHSEDFELWKLLEDARDVSIAASSNSSQVVKINISTPLGAVFYGDRRRILQILVNFLNNAEKFAEGADIEVTAGMSANGQVRFAVKDHGPGIDDSAKEKIFQRFAQAEERTSKRQGGFGLGLSIAKELVEQMGGTIGVTSVLGHGAEFWFEIPLAYSSNRPSENEVV